MLIFLVVLSAMCILGYFYLFQKFIPSDLPVKFELIWWHRLIIVLVLSVIIFWGLTTLKSSQFRIDRLFLPLLLSTISLILISLAILEIGGKLGNLRTRIRNKVISEINNARYILESAKSTREELETLGKELRIAQNSIDDKRVKISKKLVDLEDWEALLKSKEGAINVVVHQKLKEKELQLQSVYTDRINNFMQRASLKMESKFTEEKESFIADMFSFEDTDRDDFYELKKSKEALAKEREEIEKSKFLQEVDLKVTKANEHVVQAKSAALDVKSENLSVLGRIDNLANQMKMEFTKEKAEREQSVNAVLHKLELEQERRKSGFKEMLGKISVMESENKARIAELRSTFSVALNDLESKSVKLLTGLRDNLVELRLQFGKEVIRLDGQQSKIFTELEKYYSQNEKFVNQCKALSLDAKEQTIVGKDLRNQVDLQYNIYKLQADKTEARITNCLESISLKEGEFANAAGKAMLELKNVASEHYHTLKDVSLEKKDIDLIWREKNNEHELNMQELKHHQYKLDVTRNQIQQDRSNAGLNHKLFMEEQKHAMAMQKAMNSGRYLNRWN